ncbi:hypothetical protein NMY22_g3625 [Coprinellus aureogranulatus]|nr:hypothetical protein NMY22_g3625 [Coprinellus aureogranulatus]
MAVSLSIRNIDEPMEPQFSARGFTRKGRSDPPVSLLPNEVLAKVFVECLPVGRPSAISSDEAPLLLTHICSQWRSLAHALQELWVSTAVVLALYRSGSVDAATEETEAAVQAEEDRARLPFIREWFERTGTQSLHLSISDEVHFANADSCITDHILTLLDRVESLDLLVCRRTLPRFTEVSPNMYARLKRFRTVGDAFEPNGWAFLARDAPLLAEFDARMLQFPIHLLPLNFDRLTRLAVSYFPNPEDRPTTSDMLDLLRSTPRLQSLRMVMEGSSCLGKKPVQLQELRTLQLKLRRSIGPFFILARVPRLRELQLVGCDTESEPPHEVPKVALTQFMKYQPSFARNLSKLEIEPVRLASSALGKWIRYLPGLRHLVLLKPQRYRGYLYMTDVIQALTPSVFDHAAGCCHLLGRLDVYATPTPFDKVGFLYHLRSLLRNKATVSKRDPNLFSPMRIVTLPKEWEPEDGSPEAADLALCIKHTGVDFRYHEEGEDSQGLAERGTLEG